MDEDEESTKSTGVFGQSMARLKKKMKRRKVSFKKDDGKEGKFVGTSTAGYAES